MATKGVKKATLDPIIKAKDMEEEDIVNKNKKSKF